MGFAPVQVLLNISQLIIVFVWFYVENLATNIKTAQLSELCEFYRKYQNVANFASISLRKIKNAAVNERQHFKQIFKCHKFQSAANVPFCSYFYPSLSIFEVLVFPFFFK